MVAFYIVLRNKPVIFNSGLVKKVGGVGLLKHGITDVFLVSENFVDGACVPLFSSGTGKNTVALQTGGTSALLSEVKGIDDFELVTFLVVM